MSIYLGNLQLDNPFVLAPMAGVTDSPFRILCREMGAALVYGEMVSGKGIFYKDKNTEKLLVTSPVEDPVVFQIFGSEPDVIKYAADYLAPRKNVVLDINMGCPVSKIVKNQEGSFLMKNPDLVYELIKAAVSVSGKPVSAKIRLGWDLNSINAIEVASAIESAGGSFVGVHGRTREEFYHGTANWEEIHKVKSAIKIPVLGNGDIYSGKDAVEKLVTYKVDGLMIGRGSMGNPWIFKDCNLAYEWYKTRGSLDGYTAFSPTVSERMSILLRQFNMLCAEKGEYVAVRQIRSHGAWYLKGIPGATKTKQQLNGLKTADEIIRLFESHEA